MNHEECITFKNKDSLVLRGILHHGTGSEYRATCLIFLNTGLNDMAGWHRIQVKMARYFARNGYNVLRFDDAGIGDSDGDIGEESIVRIFASIESGLFVPNAEAAVTYMAERFPNNRLVYVGFCGGALTAIHSASADHRIAGLIYIGGPPTLAAEMYLEKKDPWEVGRNVERYKSKMFEAGLWIRFFSGKVDYTTAVKSIKSFVIHKLKGEYKDLTALQDSSLPANINRRLFSSYELYSKSKRPLLFYFAEIDSATWEFKKFFLNKYADQQLWRDGYHSFVEVQGANHIFSGVDSQEKLNADLLGWLQRIFC